MSTIIVAAVVWFLFGFLWYGPLFGKQWMKMMGITAEQMAEGKKKSMALPMLIALIMSVVSASVVSYLVPQLLALSFGEFLKIILIIWAGFVLPLQVNDYLWERKSFKLVLFNMVESILAYILLSAIIYYFS